MNKDTVWDENGNAVMRGNGVIVPTHSAEGREVLQRVYGRNWKNVEDNSSIYDKNGGFYLD